MLIPWHGGCELGFSGRIMTTFILYRRYHLIIGHAEKEVVNINMMEYLGCCWALFLPHEVVS